MNINLVKQAIRINSKYSTANLLLIKLASLADNENRVSITYKDMGSLVGCEAQTSIICVKWLIDRGLLEKHETVFGGVNQKNTYTLTVGNAFSEAYNEYENKTSKKGN